MSLLSAVVASAASLALGFGPSPPPLVMLDTEPGGASTAVRFQIPWDGPLVEPVAIIQHTPGSDVRGALLPDGETVVLVAETVQARDPSWAGALFRVSRSGAQTVLARSVYASTRPIVSARGLVYVLRGKAGEEPTDEGAKAGELRKDHLQVDELDPQSGKSRSVLVGEGYLFLPLAIEGDQLFVYRVAHSGADLVAVNVTSGQVRALVPALPPFAHDFFYDAPRRRLLFTEATFPGFAVWTVAVDTGLLERPLDGAHAALAPISWPDGRIAHNGPEGFSLPGKGGAVAGLGQGLAECRVFSSSGQTLACLHRSRRGALPEPRLVDTKTGERQRLTFPAGRRIDLVGFSGVDLP